MIKQINGEVLINNYIAPASTAFDFNDVVTRDANGKLAKATATTPRAELLGLIQATITSADDDYAKDKAVGVVEFHKEAEFEADVDTGTATQALVGLQFDLADEDGIDVTSNAQNAVQITGFISASKVKAKFLTDGEGSGLVSYQETVAYDAFTDGGGASGTYDLGVSIPAGAVI